MYRLVTLFMLCSSSVSFLSSASFQGVDSGFSGLQGNPLTVLGDWNSHEARLQRENAMIWYVLQMQVTTVHTRPSIKSSRRKSEEKQSSNSSLCCFTTPGNTAGK